MTDRLIVNLDPESRDLVVEALRLDSTRRQRAATKAAAELHNERNAGRKDIRSGAVMVTNLLVDAARIDEVADAIAKAPARPIVEIPPLAAAAVTSPTAGDDEVGEAGGAPPAASPADHDDDGPGVRTPEEALAETRAVIADLGLNLTAADLTDDDIDDGRLPEDEVDPSVPTDVLLAALDLDPQEA